MKVVNDFAARNAWLCKLGLALTWLLNDPSDAMDPHLMVVPLYPAETALLDWAYALLERADQALYRDAPGTHDHMQAAAKHVKEMSKKAKVGGGGVGGVFNLTTLYCSGVSVPMELTVRPIAGDAALEQPQVCC